tara:strand:- start:5684 stop:6826 length:1143 start_codon:yes stop_codon:yes gene_type:complete
MKLAVLRELRPNEKRVAATPETVKQMIKLGINVYVETDAGSGVQISDSEYVEVGAELFSSRSQLVDMDIILKVQRPLSNNEQNGPELTELKQGSVLIGLLDPNADTKQLEQYEELGITSISLEYLPRITRAQNMDVLSSQSNLAGYKAVLDAAMVYQKAMPMMMTAAGTIAPAKVFILGAGVAGLQAIATAKRLGAIVSATDVRPVVKEQVESLGAKFVMIEDEENADAETVGGYAKEMSSEYQARQEELVKETLRKTDIAICTALIPGKKAPRLIKSSTVKEMKPGSVIVDLAVEQGGNCELSECDKVVDVNGVKVVGYSNVPSRIANDASALYARNILNFLKPLFPGTEGKLEINWDDEIVKSTLITKDGKIVNSKIN